MQRKLILLLAATAILPGLTTIAVAETSAEDAFKYRQSVMTALRGHIGAVSMIMRGLVEDEGYLAKHAASMAETATEIHRVFQEGSNVGESEALPIIWDEPEKFAEAIEKAEAATAAFSEAAASGDADAISGAFRELGGACRGCHDRYRVAHD